MRRVIALACCLTWAAGVLATPERRNNVFFEVNGAELPTAVRLLLDTVYDKLPETNYMTIIPNGPIGDDVGRSRASGIYYRRAQAVYAYYQLIGVDEANLELIDKRKNGAGYYQENELEVRVYKEAAKKASTFTSLRDYFPQDVQQFTINPYEDVTITGKQGTVLNFPMYAFECADGSVPPATMTVELQEFYGYADLIKSDLHTMADGNMLETGGTINVVAKCGKTEARLSEGTEFRIEFPTKRWKEEGMETFYGGNDGRNWRASGQAVDADYWEVQQDEFNEEYYLWEYDVALAENDAALDKYILSSGELGYINCDRFYEVEEKTDFVVSVDTSLHASVKMVFADIKSIMNGFVNEKGEMQFSNIPVGQKVTLVAYTVKDDVPYMAMKQIRIGNNGYDQLKLVQTTKTAMESQFLALK